MKLLIFGGSGMAGHLLVRYFQEKGTHHVFYTTRNTEDPEGLIVDVNDPALVERTVEIVRPDVIINAVGVLNQFAEADKIGAFHVNGFLPHRLRRAADAIGARLIHISTDCVFLGLKGHYSEEEEPDGTSSYAVSKALGEIRDPGHLTIRTSIIGPEVRTSGIGLLQWFLNQEGIVHGYTHVLWNGVTTLELAKVIEASLDSNLSGLIHLAHPDMVSKYELLELFQKTWHKSDVTIVKEDGPVLDRTLRSTRSDVQFSLPPYSIMLEELAEWMIHHEVS
ncbi:dTDP-4-dehydrorhamnose reductase [Paenibacillus shirakamiensis]|uniref:dTDP-4-dehydrorhamnose reductase n=1 Tax=Paenibacillus shirakamiensis TaxID=1265935 RepID=A0ABS4JNE0_9BACL|nr:SDR family oxidoreductase [Paenibacillus shirakamiensis]MBP2002139.1 dTDP-4-dehydrorhamnose reductase [Paenibacillus shirakamiensis]